MDTSVLSSLKREVSPPRSRRSQSNVQPQPTVTSIQLSQRSIAQSSSEKSETALVEAGETSVKDPIAFFSSKLLLYSKTNPTSSAIKLGVNISGKDKSGSSPRISHHDWIQLYNRNAGSATGRHFVIHQHDHPIAGTHYDLRLQCNSTSSISFAIMYGLPGDPNSRRLNRNATETRVHNLWNHMIETASHDTGTMLIWDTGEYKVLPYGEEKSEPDSEDDKSDGGGGGYGKERDPYSEYRPGEGLPSEPQKLHDAFQRRKIKLRLNGTRLPPGYTLSLRLTRENFRSEQPQKPKTRRRKRRRLTSSMQGTPSLSNPSTTDDDEEQNHKRPVRADVSSLSRGASSSRLSSNTSEQIAIASDSNSDSEMIRKNNAYTGATNSINSIHQRRWYLSLDRRACGFVPSQKSKVYGSDIWIRARDSEGNMSGFDRFHVLGRDVERSVVTGRLAADILKDEGVEGYVPRGLWRPVTE